MPSDLLDRLVIVPTAMYTQGEIEKIVAIRAKMEGVDLDTDALHFLAEIGSSTSLRHHIAPLFVFLDMPCNCFRHQRSTPR